MFSSFRKLVLFFAIIIALFNVSGNSISAQEKNTQNEETKVQTLVDRLYETHWYGAEKISEGPTQWEFGLTEPMKKILEIGNSAQKVLLENINDENIKAEVIFLLGGVGDEKTIEPIIEAMIPSSELNKNIFAKKVNQSANLALTTITGADVIWSNGGGVVKVKCQDNAKECWEKWLQHNKKTFTFRGIKPNRRYSNYPNYGLYQDKKLWQL